MGWGSAHAAAAATTTSAAVVAAAHFFTTSWCAFTGQLVELATTGELLRRHNVSQDDVTEFILYYAKPFAARHGLPIDKLED